MAEARAHLPSLSEKQAAILLLLVAHGELFGLALVQRSHGTLKRGTVYVTLQRMEAKHYVRSRTEALHPAAIGLPRRRYQATATGLRALRLWQHVAATIQLCDAEVGA